MAIPPRITALPSPAHTDIGLWLIDIDQAPSSWDVGLLGAQEQARAARFRFEVHAARYRASHVALRLILGQVTGLHPASLAFTEGSHGKPRLAHTGAPHFNLSHSAGWALLGVDAAHPIGVDIEAMTPMDDADELARRNFTVAEYAAFSGTLPDRQLETFFQVWTRKEACLKALGSGLSIEPGEFEAGVGAHEQRTSIWVEGRPCAMRVGCIPLSIAALAAWARLDNTASPPGM